MPRLNFDLDEDEVKQAIFNYISTIVNPKVFEDAEWDFETEITIRQGGEGSKVSTTATIHFSKKRD